MNCAFICSKVVSWFDSFSRASAQSSPVRQVVSGSPHAAADFSVGGTAGLPSHSLGHGRFFVARGVRSPAQPEPTGGNTSNSEHLTSNGALPDSLFDGRRWTVGVGCST